MQKKKKRRRRRRRNQFNNVLLNAQDKNYSKITEIREEKNANLIYFALSIYHNNFIKKY